MLAESPPASGTAATNEGGLFSAGTGAATVAAPHGETAVTAGVPCVSLPSLTAILKHGGGMTPADVSGVCDLFARKEDGRRAQREMQVPGKVATPATGGSEAAAATGTGEPPVGLLGPDQTTGITGDREEATATTTPERLHNELSDAPAAGTRNEYVCDTANRTATAVVGSADQRGGVAAEGHEQAMNQGRDQAALTVSFAAVSECKVVREWIRRGAYTLPTFDVTSGQRRDTR